MTFKNPDDNPDQLKSLFKHVKDKAGSAQAIQEQYRENILVDKFRIQMVPFHLLKVTEYQAKKFSWNHVKNINEDYHPALTRCSSVAYYKGEYICWEGQHTATVNWLNGMKSVPCVVQEVEDLEFKEIPTISKFDRKELLALFNYLIEDIGATSIQDIIDHCSQPSRGE